MNDKAIIELLQQKEEQGLHEAIIQYGKALRKVICIIMASSPQEDIEEVLQDTFVKLWKKRMTLDIDKSLKSYLYAIARNTAISKLRQNNRILYVDDEILQSIPNSEDITQNIEDEELHQLIIEIIRELAEPKDQVFYCRYYLNMSIKEIAQILNLKERKVENILFREKATLRKKLEERGIHQNDR